MNPDEFSWTEDQRVTVTNPTAVPFKWRVHSKEYELGAGQTATMPGYIAWVYVYNQSVRQAQEDGVFNRWNEEDFRPTYYDKFVSGADELIQKVEVQEPLVQTLDEPVDDTSDSDVTEVPTGGETYTPKVAQRGRPVKR